MFKRNKKRLTDLEIQQTKLEIQKASGYFDGLQEVIKVHKAIELLDNLDKLHQAGEELVKITGFKKDSNVVVKTCNYEEF